MKSSVAKTARSGVFDSIQRAAASPPRLITTAGCVASWIAISAGEIADTPIDRDRDPISASARAATQPRWRRRST